MVLVFAFCDTMRFVLRMLEVLLVPAKWKLINILINLHINLTKPLSVLPLIFLSAIFILPTQFFISIRVSAER